MEVNVANETWGFMSSGSDRPCSILELENGPSSSRSEDELSQCSDNSVVSSVSKKSKKRVQFQADDNLELIYEIPPRGHYSSAEQTDSDTTDDDDDLTSSSDSSSEIIEIPQSPSSPRRFHSSVSSASIDLSLSHPSAARSSFYYNTMSPAKGSYSVSKSKDRGSSVVAKITGVIPPRSNVGGRHSGRTDKSVKRTNARNSCNVSGEEKQITTRSRAKGARRRGNVKIVDVSKSVSKRGKDNSKSLRTVSPRSNSPVPPHSSNSAVNRCNSSNSGSSRCNTSISGTARCNTSISGTPRCNNSISGTSRCSNSISGTARCNNSISGTLRYSTGKSGTPRHSSDNSGTPRDNSSSGIPRCSSANSFINGRRSSLTRSPPPKRLPLIRPKTSIYPSNKTNPSSSALNDALDMHVGNSLKNLTLGKVYTVDGFIFPQDPVTQIHLDETTTEDSNESPRDECDNSVQRKRCLSWKMANASSQSPVLHTPCILPLWESVQSVSLTSKTSVKTKL